MRSATTETHRRRLDLPDDPLEVLTCLRGRERVVALVGRWHQGEALLACDPTRVASDPFDLPVPDVVGDAGFGGGWIGVWGYRLADRLERVPSPRSRPIVQPEHRIAFYPWVLRRTRGTWWLEWLDGTDVEPVLELLSGPGGTRPHVVGAFALTPSPADHVEAVGRALEHVAAGDIFQVNLCARLEAPLEGDPLDVFCTGARALDPAFGAFVDSPDGAVASFSPELFLRRRGREVLTSPIKGTASLETPVEDLTGSAKDRAENVMIVDLMRNDLGRVCVPGSVDVPALLRPERHAVWQLVSDVVGRLRSDVGDAELLRATFPPGSVTGAPKVRAMEIAADLEATGREAYTGAIGHLSPVAGLELNVVIRTLEMAQGRAWLGVGGGIVADSDPARELAEVFTKARPVVRAVGGSLIDDVEPVPPSPSERIGGGARSRPEEVDVGRGVFTTLLVVDGRAQDLAAHVARLDASVRAVYGTTLTEGLEAAVVRRAEACGPGRHRLRVDAVPVDGAGGAGHTAVRVSLTAAPLAEAPPSWRLATRALADGWGAHKWADRTALDPPGGADDVLLVDVDGSLLETGRANLFLVLDDGVHTPPLDGRILPGTARARVLDALASLDLPAHQRRLRLDDLAAASEVFCTNALRGVVPVDAVDGRWTRPGATPTTDAVAAALAGVTRPAVAGRRAAGRPRVLFVDNYDSFVHNLVQYVGELGATTEVVRNDTVSVDEVAAGGFTHVVLSPGPGGPADAGICIDVVRRLGPTTPVLGVCLGHQAVVEAYGGRVVRAPEVVHGKASLVTHDGVGLHAGLPQPLVVARYHSLVAEESSLPEELTVTSRTGSGVVMGVRHRTHPVEGVQWHPESILTRHGHDVLAAFLSEDR
ncbi:hypothetical protein GCM10009821_22080 [Aeromicrobium halocynthiae]|uniref:Aminodeoxychorismate synthase component I n=1 Tax=Aeromicrobium halocynthiae TaxID=560557 RepID=A0ABN2W2N1_9ACTN